MQVDDQILAHAQREKRACSSLVNSLETLAWPQLHSHAQDLSMVCSPSKALTPKTSNLQNQMLFPAFFQQQTCAYYPVRFHSGSTTNRFQETS